MSYFCNAGRGSATRFLIWLILILSIVVSKSRKYKTATRGNVDISFMDKARTRLVVINVFYSNSANSEHETHCNIINDKPT